MIFLVPLLILRLLMWEIFPQYGPGMITDAIFAVWCLVALTGYYLIKAKSPLTWFILFWLTAATLSCITTSNLILSLVNVFILTVYVLLFASIKNRMKCNEVGGTWAAMVGVAAICAIAGLRESYLLHHGALPHAPAGQAGLSTLLVYKAGRAVSFQGWPTAFAGYLILFIPTAVLLFIEKRSWARGLLLGILLGGLMAAWSIIPILALSLAFILTFNVARWAWGTAIWAALAGVLIFQTKTTSFIMARMEYYEAALIMIGKHPILGSGWATFKSSGISKSVFAHNSYLQIWAETGLLGFLAIAGLTMTFWYMKPDRKEPLQLAIYTGLLAVFIDNFFSFTILKPNLSFVWWLALGLYAVIWKGKIKWT